MARRGKGVAQKGDLYPAFVAIFLAAALGLGLADPFFLKALRFIGFDGFQRVAAPAPPGDQPVRVVDIDEESLTRVGQWPWPRSKIAELTQALGQAGAAVVVFDVMFPEADRSSLEEVAKRVPPEAAAALAPLVQSWTPNDARFAAALSGVPSVLAATLTNGAAGSPPPLKAGIAIAGDDPAPFLKTFPGFTGNLQALTEAARGVGAMNWIPDRDEVVRRVPLIFLGAGRVVPSLAAEALRVAQGASTYIIKASNASGETAFGRASGVNHLRIGALEIPTDSDGGLWLHFHHVDTAGFLPAWRVLAGEVAKDEISGRIILIGTSAPGLVDQRATPLEQAVPGVAIHQQILEHILSGHYLTRPDYAPALELAVILVLGAVIAFLFPLIPAQAAAAFGVMIIAALNIGAWYAFAREGLLFDALYPSVCLFLLGTFASFYLYRRTEVQRQEVRLAFGQYVSPEVVRELIAHPEKLSLGGEVRELTLMFCDVRNFTKISERLSAEELTSFINELLTPLSDIVMSTGGTIDKYMGDAIMAFWNAPLNDAQHARHALEASARIVREMDRLNAGWQKRAMPPVKVGIGLNTGECCVGNLGSSQRFDYSVIGDEVNVCSRFEGLTKRYGLPLVTGEATVAAAADMPFLEIDLVRVKGREQPSRIFTLLSALPLEKKAYPALKQAQAEMLEAYRMGNWAGAESAIGKARALSGAALSPYYDLFVARIATYKLAPPSPDWNGVFDALEK